MVVADQVFLGHLSASTKPWAPAMTRRTYYRAVPWRVTARIATAPLLLLPCAAGAQLVVGRVVDDLTNGPVPTTSVLLVDSLANVVGSVLSDDDGRFVLRAPGSGTFSLYADQLGYDEMASEPFVAQGSGSVALELRLTPRPFELRPLVVTAGARNAKLERHGFYRRRATAVSGYFLDAGDLRDQHALRLTDVLRTVPAVQVRRTVKGGTTLLSRRGADLLRGSGGCPMKVVLDGFKRELLPDESVDDWFDLAQVAGIEVYPGAGGVGAPVQQRGPDAFCGIVLIWTR